ncbi:superoxide dismutase [Robertmurraya kyonggiensis]|uniref:superoxide dismutase n=1 Tax=Robertmurraya kyonggiensis TaxID=1037680 RepID=A0A4U1DB17_9BACI|nr:superoxide dismutase [Robertmurraya kyonggiensis]TKC19771.1 superoxide dismutase [Robertmurraya kyonggiensis]
MGKFEDYVQEVMGWNQEWKKFLESEQVDRDDDIWKKLDGLTEVLETVGQPGNLNDQQLWGLQSKVEELHHNMEEYFIKRQEIGTIFMRDPFVEVGKHTLPPLPYAYNALEPVISEEIMRIHHTKHHQSYVDGLNKAEKKLEDARKSGDFSLVKHWSRELAFHGSGHYLHTIFWNNMTPNGGGKPSGKLIKEIEKYFGSFEAFKKQFTEAAKAVEGVGWAILVWSPRSRRLEILQSERHMILTQWDTIPLLVLDVWEHAYYLQYKNERAQYVDKWWNIVNWNDVEQRFLKAKQLTWKPY